MSADLPRPPVSPRPADASGSEGYGYGYGQPSAYGYYGGYYGGGYGGYGGGGDHGSGHGSARSIQDYLVMVRERFWYLVLTVFVCFVSVMIYTVNVTPEWQAAAKLRVYRAPYTTVSNAISGVPDNINNVATNEDFLTQIEMMKSTSIMNAVAQRLSQEQKRQVLEPYQDGNIFTGPLREQDVLAKCYDVKPQRQTLVAYISYSHPDKEVARFLASLFAEEIIRYNSEERSKIATPMIELMGVQIKSKNDAIEDLYKKRTALIAEKGVLTITTQVNTAQAELTNLAVQKHNAQQRYEEIEALWKQMKALKKDSVPTTNMSVIANNERVMAMENVVSQQRIAVKGLAEHFTESHPQMIAAMQQLKQAETERATAIASAEAKIEQEYQSAQSNFISSKSRFEEKEKQLEAMNTAQNEWEILNKEIMAQERLRDSLQQTYEAERIKTSGAAAPSISTMEEAMITTNRPINKNYIMRGAIGVVAGIVLGCGIIFVLAFFDDRVKSSNDIEGYLGLPLIGILPIARKMNSFSKARVVATGEDRPLTEGFRSIYSALKINEQSKLAKTFLTTSTMPSEGKSFVTTNLAMIFAMHGERVLIIDADLRMPAVGKTLQLEGDRGITRYLQGATSLDDAIHHDVVPNLDVLAVGAPCKNPTQILNSQRLVDMISGLKTRYDRVFIDSPPIGAVSDSLNLLPQVDGVVYVVRFNTVKRRFIKANVRRLQESRVPIFGAVLNQIGLRVARYYTNSGDRAYSKYYSAESADSVEVKV